MTPATFADLQRLSASGLYAWLGSEIPRLGHCNTPDTDAVLEILQQANRAAAGGFTAKERWHLEAAVLGFDVMSHPTTLARDAMLMRLAKLRDAHVLDYPALILRVEGMLAAKRPGLVRCYACLRRAQSHFLADNEGDEEYAIRLACRSLRPPANADERCSELLHDLLKRIGQ